MKPSEFLLEGSKPTQFDPFRRNAEKAFSPLPEPEAFRVYLKNDKKTFSAAQAYDIATFGDTQTQEEFIIGEFLEKLKKSNPEKYENLTSDDVAIDYVTQNNPEINDGELSNNVVSSATQRVQQHAATFRDQQNVLQVERVINSGSTTVDTIQGMLEQSAEATKLPYYKSFIGHLIANSDKPFKPYTVINDVKEYGQAGFKKGNSTSLGELLNDFGEVAGPVGLLSRSINGNAVRLLGKFLRNPDGTEPTTAELQSEATIHFHPSQVHMLVDSYIEFRGKVLRLSSKNAGDQLSGGQGASVDGIFKSLEEISANPEAKKSFEELLRSKPEYSDVFDNIRLIAGAFTQTEQDQGLKGYIAQFNLLSKLTSKDGINVSNHDAQILKSIWDAAGETDTGVNDFKHLLGAAFGNRPDVDLSGGQQYGEFTPEFQNLLKKFNLNRFGEPGLSGVEDIKSNNDARGWWLRLKKSLIFHISKAVNNDPKFSEMCTWILNHGAFVQIDTRYREQTHDKIKSVAIMNISATWPSNAVDRVKLVPLPSGDGFKYKLDINGGSDFSDKRNSERLAAEPNNLDYDFGFKTKEEQSKAYRDSLPTQQDLARNAKNWLDMGVTKSDKGLELQMPNTRSNDKNTNSRSYLLLNTMFKNLESAKIIAKAPETESEKLETGLQLALRILQGYSPEYLEKSIIYAINSVWAMPTKVNEALDDEEGEEEPEEEDSEKPTLTKKQQAVADATLARNILEVLYDSLRVNEQFKKLGGKNTVNDMELARRIELLQQAVNKTGNSWPRFKQVLEPRFQGQEPTYVDTKLQKIIRAHYKDAVYAINQLVQDGHRNRDNIIALATWIATGKPLGQEFEKALLEFFNNPNISQFIKSEISEDDERGTRELRDRESAESLRVLYYAMQVRNVLQSNIDTSTKSKNLRVAQENLLNSIATAFGVASTGSLIKSIRDRMQAQQHAQEIGTQISRQATERSLLQKLKDDSTVPPPIKTYILGIKKYERQNVVQSNGVRTMQTTLVDDPDTQQQAAADYYDWGHDDPGQFLEDIKLDYPQIPRGLREGVANSVAVARRPYRTGNILKGILG